MTTEGKNRIIPKEDGTYVVEFKTAAGEATAISIPRTEAAVIRHFPAQISREKPSTMENSQIMRVTPGSSVRRIEAVQPLRPGRNGARRHGADQADDSGHRTTSFYWQ